ncbi:MAG: flagellar biosynthesis regulator FlaF [Pseudomonadota bacterium]|jgi:flagellar protein FlaF
MSSAAQAYARVAQTTASPREIEAQALLKAANKLQSVLNDWDKVRNDEIAEAVLFNRKLWSIFLSAATDDKNPQALDVRQNVANIGVFVMTQTYELQINPRAELLPPLIEINRNLAAGLSGRA